MLPGTGYCKESTTAKGQDGSKARYHSHCHSKAIVSFWSGVITLWGSELGSWDTQDLDFLVPFPDGSPGLALSQSDAQTMSHVLLETFHRITWVVCNNPIIWGWTACNSISLNLSGVQYLCFPFHPPSFVQHFAFFCSSIISCPVFNVHWPLC